MPETKKKNFQLLMLDVDPKTGRPRTRPVSEVFREDAELLGGGASTIMNTMAKFVDIYESGWNKVYGTRVGKKVIDAVGNKVGEKMRQKGLGIVPPARISEEEERVKAYRKEKEQQSRDNRKSGLMN